MKEKYVKKYSVRASNNSSITRNYCGKVEHRSFAYFTRRSNYNKSNVKLKDLKPKRMKQIWVSKVLSCVANPSTTDHDRIKKFEGGKCSNSVSSVKC